MERKTHAPAPKRIVALINPASGQQLGKAVEEMLVQNPYGVEVEVVETRADSREQPRLAAKLVEERQADRFLIAGGDGTVLAGLSALLERNLKIPMAIIPAGTGNIICCGLNVPLEIEDTVRLALTEANIHWWDVGQLPNEKLFFALRASAGYEADAVARMNPEHKKPWGLLSYIVPALQEFLTVNPIRYTLTIDDHAPFDIEGINAFVAVTNRIGGTIDLKWSEDIRPDDGVLHVGIFHPKNILQNLPVVLKSGIIDSAENAVSLYPVEQQVRIDADPIQQTQVDGELIGETPLIVRNRPRAAPFIVLPAT